MLGDKGPFARTLIACLLAAAGMAACAPLAQAPLVYSSKTSFGVDLSATSTETPGISFSLGSKQVDAAYVPIAVSVPCLSSQGQSVRCTGKEYELHQITGRNVLQNSSSPTAIRYQQARQELEDATAKLLRAQAALRDAQSAYSRDQELAEQAPPVADPPPGQPALALTPQQTEAEAARKRLPGDRAEIQRINGDVASFTTNVNNAKLGLDEAAAANSVSNSTTLEDAYSVFGTFDGKGDGVLDANHTNTAKASGGLSVGKMFSTGIASQHLSSAIKLQYVGTCLDKTADAFKAINGATGLDDGTKKQVLSSIAALCATAYRSIDTLQAPQ